MRNRNVLLGILFSITSNAADFPTTPHPQLTPGELCGQPDKYRYAERIPYCERDVESETKALVIKEYDRELDYNIEKMNRQDFKIDHLIPLCAGGSNTRENLWPQHKSIYELTDPLEGDVCQLMSMGAMLQRDAIQLIRQAKKNPSTGPALHRDLMVRIKGGKRPPFSGLFRE